MPSLSHLEKSTMNIATLGVPETKSVGRWNPERYFNPDVWQKLCEACVHFFENSEYDEALTIASGLTLLFPERRSEIPLTLAQIDGMLDEYEEIFDDPRSNPGQITDVLHLVGRARLMEPRYIAGFNSLNPEFLVVAKEKIRTAHEEGYTHLFWRRVIDYCLATGEILDLSIYDGVATGRSILSLDNVWNKSSWKDTDLTVLVTEPWAAQLYHPEEVKNVRPPLEVMTYIDARLKQLQQTEPSFFVSHMVGMSVLMAERIEFHKWGVSITKQEVMYTSKPAEGEPPLKRSF